MCVICWVLWTLPVGLQPLWLNHLTPVTGVLLTFFMAVTEVTYRRKSLFGLYFEGRVHHSGEVMEAREWGVYNQEAEERWQLLPLWFLFFMQPRTTAYEMAPSLTGVGLPNSLSPVWKHPHEHTTSLSPSRFLNLIKLIIKINNPLQRRDFRTQKTEQVYGPFTCTKGELLFLSLSPIPHRWIT